VLLFSRVHSDRCYGCGMAHWTLMVFQKELYNFESV
jgi:hypothetical protein